MVERGAIGASEADLGPVLDQWPELEPDPEAMAQIAFLMGEGVGAVREETVPGEPAQPDGAGPLFPNAEVRWFKLFALLWAALALVVYWVWPSLIDWLSDHPVWATVVAVFVLICLLSPLLLLPGLQGERSVNEGGRLSC